MANFYNEKNGAKIKGTSKADQIYNSGGNNVSINADAGNDNIQNSGNNVTISGGKGNDNLQNEWNAGTVYIYTEGNDTINDFNEMDNLVIANAKWTSQQVDDNTIVVNVKGKGTITLINNSLSWGSKINIVSSMSDIRYYNSISNDKDRKTVKGSAANDNIYNAGNNVSINAGNGFNRISNGEWYNDAQGALRGHRTTITSGKNDDVIWNSADYVLVNAGNGDDAVDNIHAKTSVTINAGAGKDSIINFAARSLIDGEEGNDFITNDFDSRGYWGDGSNVTIDAGDGDDLIDGNSGESVKIFGGKGSDTVYNWKEGNKVTIAGGDGSDFITNYGGSNLSIAGGDGDDNISNREGWYWNEQTQKDEYTVPDNATILGGKGNDRIYNYGNKASVNGGVGNDYIYNGIWESTNTWGSQVTLDGGAGDDTISNAGAKVSFVYSGGNDIIYGFNKTSTLKISSGTVSSVKTNGSDYFVSVGKSIVTLQGAAQFGKANIVNSKGKAVKYSVNKNFVGTAKSDSFTNYLAGAKINAGNGDDYISNYGAKVSINAGDGSNRIYNNVNRTWNNETNTYETLGSPDNTTIIAGKGNDYIYNGGANVLIKYSGGEDTINGFNETSTLQISSGKISSVTTNGTDYFLKIGKNILRVNGAAQLSKVNIVNSKGKAIEFTVKDVNTITNKKNNRTLTGSADRDKITNSGKKVLINGVGGDDTISNSGATSTLNGGDGNDSINNTGDSVKINGGAGKDNISNEGAKVTIAGGKDNDEIVNRGSQVSINAGAGNDFIYNDGGNLKVTINGGAGNDEIVNNGSQVSIEAGAGNDSIQNWGDNVTILGGKGKDTLWGSSEGAEKFIYSAGDGDDFIYGFDDNDTLKLNNLSFKASYKNDAVILKFNSGSITLKDFSATTFHIDSDTYKISGSKFVKK